MRPVNVRDAQLPQRVRNTLAKLKGLDIDTAERVYSISNARLEAAGVTLDDLRVALAAGVAQVTDGADLVVHEASRLFLEIQRTDGNTVIRLAVNLVE